MNISHRWLLDLAPTISGSPSDLADRLGMLGAPVDELVELAADIRDIVIARVEEVRQHPNADRLRVCTVDAGGAERLQVVCGAPNVRAGGYYPFAPVGASLPGGTEIRKAKLRGESSEGMLCSARELGLGRDHAGLMALAGEWSTGSSLVDELGLDDARLLLDVTANRPDLLSHLGVARELAPGGVDDIRLEPFGETAPRLEIANASMEGEASGVGVRIEDEEGCPRYLAAVVRGVKVAPSPEWLATRLRSVGLRPINNVVDATNYVLHELGQPLHAFDLERVRGSRIRVRRAERGENLLTLDGVERALDPEMLVIADAEGPIALAGVMGGQESEVSESTTTLLVECALFDPKRVRRTARGLGLSTDASYRFERGVDPELQPVALRRVVDLIVTVAGGEADPPALDVTAREIRRSRVALRQERVQRLLGSRMEAAEIAELLRTIGFGVEGSDGMLDVEIPGFRPDVTREVDLVEEVARRRGYESFPEELLPFRPSTAGEDPLFAVTREVRALLGRRGFLEARTAGFAPAAAERVPLLNPLSADESHLRDSLTPGLLRRVEHNWAHGVRHVRLFEIGTVFSSGGGGELPTEEVRVAAVFTGARRPPHWSGPTEAWDLWDLKALLGELGELLGGGPVVAAASVDAPVLAGAGLRLAGGEESSGEGGRVGESAVDAPLWADAVWALELRLPSHLPKRVRPYAPLPEQPVVERDLALLLPAGVEASQVEEVLRGAAGELLNEVWPFDLYAGKGIPEGTRSVAWRLRFLHPDRTLTDAEVERAVESVLIALDQRLNVHRR